MVILCAIAAEIWECMSSIWYRCLVHHRRSMNAHYLSLALFLSWGGRERLRLLEDKAQRWSPQGWGNSLAAEWEQRRIGGGRDQRLNYADYSFVSCSLHLPPCLLGRKERQTHTICTQIHKTTYVQTCTQTQTHMGYTLPHHTKKAHGRGYLCLLTRMFVRTPNTCSSTCSCSHSEAHVPMNTGKPTTTWLQASTCACAGTRVFTTISPHENAHKCLSMCACTLFSNSQL